MPREAAPADRQPCFHTDAENYRFRAMHGQKQNNRKFRHYLKKTESSDTTGLDVWIQNISEEPRNQPIYSRSRHLDSKLLSRSRCRRMHIYPGCRQAAQLERVPLSSDRREEETSRGRGTSPSLVPQRPPHWSSPADFILR